MLLILYNCPAETVSFSKQFFVETGFEFAERISVNPKSNASNLNGDEIQFVSRNQFFQTTDSLFRYMIGDRQFGYSQAQISEAINGSVNLLLFLPIADVSTLREIKEVYNESVKMVYCHTDITTLNCDTSVKMQYPICLDVFDYVVIFNGKASQFNLDQLRVQYQCIVDSLTPASRNGSYDIFLSFARKDSWAVNVIRNKLENRGFSVFDEKTIPFGARIDDFIKKAISASRAIVPVLTKNSNNNKFISQEIEYALQIANDSAVLVIPVFLDSEFDYEETDCFLQLPLSHGVISDDGDVNEVGDRLADMIEKLFTGLDRLELYSEQVNSYIYIKDYKSAIELQRTHRDLCIDLYNLSNGKYVGLDEIINSAIKLISILMDSDNWTDALEEVLDTLSLINDESGYRIENTLKEQFAICCIECGYNESDVSAIIDDHINKYQSELEHFGRLFDHHNYELCKDLMEEFAYKKAHYKRKAEGSTKADSNSNDTISIAEHGRVAMDIFNSLLCSELTEHNRRSILEGYQRVLNYCIQIGLSGQMAEECVKRIAELRQTKTECTSENRTISSALKVFLGQAAPGSGCFDVFISFKSEDDALARRVYEYLRQNGKETFFSPDTLPLLGESEYEDAIYDALDRSKHMVLVASNPEYFKTDWVSREWKFFNNKNRKSEAKGNIVILLPEEFVKQTEKLPPQLRYDYEIISISDFRNSVLSYLR